MDLLVEARSLVKKYGTSTALNGIHLEVHRGKCIGLFGPKGSGKSTLLKMIHCGSLVSAGELFVFGLNVKKNGKKIRQQLGVMPAEFDLNEDLCIFDNLLLFARYFGYSSSVAKVKVKSILRALNIADCETSFTDKLDGYKKKLIMLARALLNDPKLLLVDEPTSGLNHQDSFLIWQVLSKLNQQGLTILLASDRVNEVEFLTDSLYILDKGKVLVSGEPKSMIVDRIGHEVVEFSVHSEDIEYYLRKIKERYSYQVLNSRIRLFVDDGQDSRAALDMISSENIVVRKASLEDVFLRLSGYEIGSKVMTQ